MSDQAETKLPAISSIKVSEHGRFLPATFEDVQRLGKMYLESQMLPSRFKTIAAVVTAMQFSAELGLNGIVPLRQIAVINGSPTLFGDLPLAIVRASGQLEKIEEFLVTADGTRISMANKNLSQPFAAAVCILKRKGENEREFYYSVDDAKTAGLWGKNVWAPHPKRMIQMRTRGWGLKDVFADLLNGAALGEYDHDTIIENVVESEVVSTKINGAAGRINALKAVPTTPEEAPKVEPPAQEPPQAEVKEQTPVVAAKEPEVLPAETKAAAPAAAQPAQDDQPNFDEFVPGALGVLK